MPGAAIKALHIGRDVHHTTAGERGDMRGLVRGAYRRTRRGEVAVRGRILQEETHQAHLQGRHSQGVSHQGGQAV